MFKLSEIHALFVNRLEDLGIKKLINKTRLKQHLLQHFSEAQEQYDGKKHCYHFLKRNGKCVKGSSKRAGFYRNMLLL